MAKTLTFLKLGGSLITKKDQPYTADHMILNRISQEIYEYIKSHPDDQLILGHGSGSYGHTSASRYHTRQGVRTPEEWFGFCQVNHDARNLNQIVVQALITAGVPAVSIPPSTQVVCADHLIAKWDTAMLEKSLQRAMVPVVFGDAVFDSVIGGTILSTEDLFQYLALIFQPGRILLAGIEAGVWMEFPTRSQLIPLITPATYPAIMTKILGSESVDVTGGMRTKIEQMLHLVTGFPDMTVQVFSGTEPKAVYNALGGAQIGTTIRFDERNPS